MMIASGKTSTYAALNRVHQKSRDQFRNISYVIFNDRVKSASELS